MLVIAVLVVLCVAVYASFTAGRFHQLGDMEFYGYYDAFNEVFYTDEVEAWRAVQGGNKVMPVYFDGALSPIVDIILDNEDSGV